MCEGKETSGAAVDLNGLNYLIREPVKGCPHPSEHGAPLDHDYGWFEQFELSLEMASTILLHGSRGSATLASFRQQSRAQQEIDQREAVKQMDRHPIQLNKFTLVVRADVFAKEQP